MGFLDRAKEKADELAKQARPMAAAGQGEGRADGPGRPRTRPARWPSRPREKAERAAQSLRERQGQRRRPPLSTAVAVGGPSRTAAAHLAVGSVGRRRDGDHGYGRNPWVVRAVRHPCTNGLPERRSTSGTATPSGVPNARSRRVTEHVHAVHPEPDLVQLLTPEGQRVEHPDYPLDITDDEIAALYRDLVLVRRIDTEAIALQRQGELGLWASLLGQEAAQIGAGRALQPHDMAFPTYREHGVAWCRDVDPLTLLGLFRGTNLGGFDPREHNFNLYTIVIGAQTLHAAGYAMGVVRDGAVGTGDPDRDTAVLAFFGDGASSQGDVNEAFVWAARRQPAGRLLLPEQPVGDQRAGRAAEPGAALPARERLRLPRRPRRRQRRARLPRRHPQGARRRPQRAGPDADRGVHLPDEPAHHQRRPAPLPARQRGRDLEAQGPDRAGARLPDPRGRLRRRLLRRASRPRPRSWPSTSAPAAARCPTRRRSRCSTTSTSPCPTTCAPSAATSSTSSRRSAHDAR